MTSTGPDAYTVTVPEYVFIGLSEPTFETPVDDGGILQWVTPDIDQLELVNEILSVENKQEYIDSNRDLLEEQTRAFYDGLITGIAPEAKVSYTFAN